MAHTKQDPSIRTGKNQTVVELCFLKGESELENMDRQAGHQYLPMDVYIAPKTMDEHFNASSIRSRLTKFHKTTS